MNAYKDNLYELPFDEAVHQKDDQDLFVGAVAREYLQINERIDTPAWSSGLCEITRP